jgi:DNA-binding NarL/FixJ family response regulator
VKRKDGQQRQDAVYKLLAQGKTNKEIAYRLGMTYDSVVHNVECCLRQYGASNRVILALKYHNIYVEAK